MHCGHCEFCLQGRDNHCVARKSIGKWRPGGYSELVSLPIAALIEVPQHLDPVQVALVEPVATPLHGINAAAPHLARPLREAKCLVLGGGAIGFIAEVGLHEQTAMDIQKLTRAGITIVGGANYPTV